MHAAILADLDPKSSWDKFTTALESDVSDIQGGTTKEGIHMGVMAGALDLIQRGYMGAEIQDRMLCFSPKPNERLDGLSFPLRFRKTQVEIALKEDSLMVAVHTDGLGRTIEVSIGDESREIKDGEHYLSPVSSYRDRRLEMIRAKVPLRQNALNLGGSSGSTWPGTSAWRRVAL